MKEETLKHALRHELIECKSIVDFDEDDPFVAVYLDKLTSIVNKMCQATREETIGHACKWLRDRVDVPWTGESNGEDALAEEYIDHAMRRLEVADETVKNFKEYLEQYA